MEWGVGIAWKAHETAQPRSTQIRPGIAKRRQTRCARAQVPNHPGQARRALRESAASLTEGHHLPAGPTHRPHGTSTRTRNRPSNASTMLHAKLRNIGHRLRSHNDPQALISQGNGSSSTTTATRQISPTLAKLQSMHQTRGLQ